jgi:hypothetical protein
LSNHVFLPRFCSLPASRWQYKPSGSTGVYWPIVESADYIGGPATRPLFCRSERPKGAKNLGAGGTAEKLVLHSPFPDSSSFRLAELLRKTSPFLICVASKFDHFVDFNKMVRNTGHCFKRSFCRRRQNGSILVASVPLVMPAFRLCRVLIN